MSRKLAAVFALTVCLLGLITILRPGYSAAQPRPEEQGVHFAEDQLSYLPLVIAPVDDLAISRLEITQAVQNVGNNVPLVQDRPAFVRVYAWTTGLNPSEPVSVTLSASRGGQSLGTLYLGPGAAPRATNPGDLTSTFNFWPPAAWLSGRVAFVAKVDAGENIQELDETNNAFTETVTFEAVPPLDLTLVPINYTHEPHGTYFPGPTSDTVSGRVIHFFPLNAVNVSIRSPIDFSGDLSLGSEWSELMRKVADVKNADGSPGGQVYYGVIPTSNDNGDHYPRAWGGYAAIGWIRAGVGIEGAETLAAHEIGHNFGLRHAPCGNPAGVDDNYPYPDGSIGQYGYDVFNQKLWAPYAPDYAVDLMTYCWPEWISDYH